MGRGGTSEAASRAEITGVGLPQDATDAILYGRHRRLGLEQPLSDMELCDFVINELEGRPGISAGRRLAIGRAKGTYERCEIADSMKDRGSIGWDSTEAFRELAFTVMCHSLPDGGVWTKPEEDWPLSCSRCEDDLDGSANIRFIQNEQGCHCMPCLVGPELAKVLEDPDPERAREWLRERYRVRSED